MYANYLHVIQLSLIKELKPLIISLDAKISHNIDKTEIYTKLDISEFVIVGHSTYVQRPCGGN